MIDGGTSNSLRFSLASDIVELVVLTNDEAFLQTMREAVGEARRLWHVPTSDKVSDLLVAGEVGILVLDTQGLDAAPGEFIEGIKRQFPNLVIVVAGNLDAEGALASLISSGIVYRFIHKPMSPARAKLFAEAAVKKHEEQRYRSATLPAKKSSVWPNNRGFLIGGAGVLILIAAAVVLRHKPAQDATVVPPTPGTAAHQPTQSAVLLHAAAALAANQLTEPSGDNALELYRQELGRNPDDSAARAGLADVHERLLARAENALLEERLDEALSDIEVARKAGVDGARIAFLSAQLAKSREQVKSQVKIRINADTHASEEKVTRFLNLAMQRVNEGHLTEPVHDNARFYIDEALRIDAHSSAAQSAAQSLQARVAAIERKRNEANTQETLLKNALERVAQDRLVEPANDSAKYYVMTLRSLDPNNPALASATADLGSRLLTKARRALALAQYDAARSWLGEASAVGSGALTLTKSVLPSYPQDLERRKIQGWVELDFTVAESGEVKDIEVHQSTPAGVFDQAAIRALAQWRYRPILRDAKPIAQRARIRIRFNLAS